MAIRCRLLQLPTSHCRPWRRPTQHSARDREARASRQTFGAQLHPCSMSATNEGQHHVVPRGGGSVSRTSPGQAQRALPEEAMRHFRTCSEESTRSSGGRSAEASLVLVWTNSSCLCPRRRRSPPHNRTALIFPRCSRRPLHPLGPALRSLRSPTFID